MLCLGCHSDDIEIGCGGTILHWQRSIRTAIFIGWYSAQWESVKPRQNTQQSYSSAPPRLRALLKSFPDGFMPFAGGEIKAAFEEMKRTVSPDLIFTHNRKDAHQDHRLIAELTWNTFRDHLILEYEIPKYDGDMGQPNVFIPLETAICEKKIAHSWRPSSRNSNKRWFQPETFRSLMRLRGMECNASSGYAEAFYCRKMVI